METNLKLTKSPLHIKMLDGLRIGEFLGLEQCYSLDFIIGDTGKRYNLLKGMCRKGFYHRPTGLRYCIIYVVRQHDVWKNTKVLIHELCHAAIWLLHLPQKWDVIIDTKIT